MLLSGGPQSKQCFSWQSVIWAIVFITHGWLFFLRGKPYCLSPLERAPSHALRTILEVSWHRSSLGYHCCSLLHALVWKMLEKNWVVTSKHGGPPSHPSSVLEAQGSVSVSVHPCHLNLAQCSTNFVVLGQLGHLLWCISVTGPFTCYGDMKCLMSFRRPAIKHLVET